MAGSSTDGRTGPLLGGGRSNWRWPLASSLFGAVVAADSLRTTSAGTRTDRLRLLSVSRRPAARGLEVGVFSRPARGSLATLRHSRRAQRSVSVFWPTAAAVAGAMFVLGCYVPSAVYLAWMMRAHGVYWLAAPIGCRRGDHRRSSSSSSNGGFRCRWPRARWKPRSGSTEPPVMTELSSLLSGFETAFSGYHVA